MRVAGVPAVRAAQAGAAMNAHQRRIRRRRMARFAVAICDSIQSDREWWAEMFYLYP